jgi:hypothetical protein
VLFNLGAAQREAGEISKAEKTLKAGLAIGYRDERINRLYVALFVDELAMLNSTKSKPLDSYAALKRAIEVMDRNRGTGFFQSEIDCCRTFALLPRLNVRLARICRQANRLEEACVHMKNGADIRASAYPNSEQSKRDFLELASMLREAGKAREAIEWEKRGR